MDGKAITLLSSCYLKNFEFIKLLFFCFGRIQKDTNLFLNTFNFDPRPRISKIAARPSYIEITTKYAYYSDNNIVTITVGLT